MLSVGGDRDRDPSTCSPSPYVKRRAAGRRGRRTDLERRCGAGGRPVEPRGLATRAGGALPAGHGRGGRHPPEPARVGHDGEPRGDGDRPPRRDDRHPRHRRLRRARGQPPPHPGR